MNREHHQLIHTIGDYGKAMQEQGKNPSEENHQSACNQWGNVSDRLDKHFNRGWWKRFVELFFGWIC